MGVSVIGELRIEHGPAGNAAFGLFLESGLGQASTNPALVPLGRARQLGLVDD